MSDMEQDYGSDIDDADIDDELMLPDILANIGLKEKRLLLNFKRGHTDVSQYLISFEYKNLRLYMLIYASRKRLCKA